MLGRCPALAPPVGQRAAATGPTRGLLQARVAASSDARRWHVSDMKAARGGMPLRLGAAMGGVAVGGGTTRMRLCAALEASVQPRVARAGLASDILVVWLASALRSGVPTALWRRSW